MHVSLCRGVSLIYGVICIKCGTVLSGEGAGVKTKRYKLTKSLICLILITLAI